MSALHRTFGRMRLMLFLATEVVKKRCRTKARRFSWVGWQQFSFINPRRGANVVGQVVRTVL